MTDSTVVPTPNAVPVPPPVGTTKDRPTGLALRRSVGGRCPACGEGRLFSRFLKVADHCPDCDEPLFHQRADDGPAYLTIFIVAHLLTPLLLIVFLAWRPSETAMVIGFVGGAVVLSLLLLPRIKGGFVGFQWARRMHGFGQGEASTE